MQGEARATKEARKNAEVKAIAVVMKAREVERKLAHQALQEVK